MKSLRNGLFVGIAVLMVGLWGISAARPAQAAEIATCIATVEHLGGQGRYALNGAGRYALNGAGRYALNGAEGLDQAQTALVLDHQFGPEWMLHLAPSLFDPSYETNEAVALLIVDDFSFFGGQQGGKSHGYLVQEVAEDFAAALESRYGHRVAIHVFAINVAGAETAYQTDLLASAIDHQVNGALSAYKRVMINMSFAAIPCRDEENGFDFYEFITIFENDQEVKLGYPTYNLQQYVVEELGMSEEEAANYLLSLLQDRRFDTEASHLKDLLRGYLHDEQRMIWSVASAGNFADWFASVGASPEPFAPARWDETIAVSASHGFYEALFNNRPDALWEYSQPGDLSMPGAWYYFKDDHFRAGTSFAAPVASVTLAAYLSHAHPERFPCAVGENGLPLRSPGVWENSWLYAEPLACTLFDQPYGGGSGVQLEPALSVSDNAINPGEFMTFTLTLTNWGSSTATRAKLLARFPGASGLNFNSAAGAGYYNPSTGVWWIGDLAQGNAQITLSATGADNTRDTLAVYTVERPSSDQTGTLPYAPSITVIVGAPAAPAYLTATAGQSAVQFNWADKSITETGFRLQRFNTRTLMWTTIVAVGANQTSYTLNGYSCGGSWRVVAYNDNGFAASNVISGCQ